MHSFWNLTIYFANILCHWIKSHSTGTNSLESLYRSNTSPMQSKTTL